MGEKTTIKNTQEHTTVVAGRAEGTMMEVMGDG
jgi:hypothetical protein